MKNKKLLLVLVAMIAMMSMVLTSCGGPKTIEDYANSDSDFQQQMADIEKQNTGLHISFSGNTVIYDFDFAEMGSYTESQIVNDSVKSNLENGLNTMSSQYASIISQMEDETEITGVEMVVNYKYGDTMLATASFDKNGKK